MVRVVIALRKFTILMPIVLLAGRIWNQPIRLIQGVKMQDERQRDAILGGSIADQTVKGDPKHVSETSETAFCLPMVRIVYFVTDPVKGLWFGWILD